MTTNIDELIADLYEQRMISDSEVVALRLQQKRIEELEGASKLGQLLRAEALEAKLSAIRQAVDVANHSDSRHYPDCVLIFKADWKAILSAVEDAPAQQPEQGEK